MGGNVIKNKIIDVNEELGNETLLKLNMLLNTTSERNVDRADQSGSDRKIKRTGRDPQSGDQQCTGCSSRDRSTLDDDMEIYTSGATNIFKYPELE